MPLTDNNLTLDKSTSHNEFQHITETSKQLCHRFSQKSERSLEEICSHLMRVLLNVEENFDESFCNKECAQLLWSVFVEAARNNIDSDTFSGLIGTSDICCAILRVYNENKSALRDTMETIGWEYPKVVGIDWSILSVVESNSNMEIEEPLAEITLKTLGTGDSSTNLDTFKFLCNKNHLQEFHWKVKEVNNILQSFAHKSG